MLYQLFFDTEVFSFFFLFATIPVIISIILIMTPSIPEIRHDDKIIEIIEQAVSEAE